MELILLLKQHFQPEVIFPLLRKRNKEGSVTLLYIWLNSPEFAIGRVAKRVSEGGHHIPSDVIVRRYYRGISNLFNLYIPICNDWVIVSNMQLNPKIVARGSALLEKQIIIADIWEKINEQSNGY
jgi:predicted ABC-type ATPase